jgi:hypothetical protein
LCQHHAPCQAPWIRRKVFGFATRATIPSRAPSRAPEYSG